MPAIYQSDVWCDSCADAIRARLNPNHLPVGDESEYDSDDYPKYMDEDGESDSPQHCGSHSECLEAESLPDGVKIGALLSTTLTSEGIDYVLDAIASGGAVAEFWREKFSDVYDLEL